MEEAGGDGAGSALGPGQEGDAQFDPAEFRFQVREDLAQLVEGGGVGHDQDVEVAPAVLVLAPSAAAGDGQQVDQRAQAGGAVEELGQVGLQVHGESERVDRYGGGLVLRPAAVERDPVQPPLQRQARPVVADDLARDGDDLVRAPCAFDVVPVGDVLGPGGAPPHAGGLGGVQIGDGELGPEHPGEFGGRVAVVQRLDADGVEKVVGMAEAVQRVHDQLGLHDRLLADLGSVRLRQGDVDGAMATWRDFLDCADGIRSVKVQAALQDMRVRLRRYSGVAETQELCERAARITG
ncbi:hypothetical protein ACIRNI_03195 [Streptomyces sp. NPDC093546]|uniref:hypothetical protein n=1 Tax=Streptomyces sp. NPDC093546 TaxID=3366040 RepID=UPI0037F1A7FB